MRRGIGALKIIKRKGIRKIHKGTRKKNWQNKRIIKSLTNKTGKNGIIKKYIW